MPYRPNERLYRTFAASNFQPVVREAEEEETQEPSYVVKGYFTTFDEPYALFDDFYETIDHRALDGADMTDVIFQLNHEGAPLARIRNKSLRVGIDEHGGWCEADLGGCQQGREIYESIQNGLIDRMSFGFTIADDGFDWYEDEDGIIHSTITSINKVFDCSAVSIPANPGTDISARSYLDGAIEAKRKQQELLQREEQDRIEAERTAKRKRAAAALKLSLSRLG